MSTPSNLPVERPKVSAVALIPEGLPDWFAPGGAQAYVTTIPNDTEEGYALTFRAALGKDKRLIDAVNMTLSIRYWLASPYDGVDEDTGEQVQSVRIALVDDTGTVWVTYSLGVRRSLLLLTGKYGLGEWKPPVTVRVATAPAKVGQLLFLQPVPSGVAQPEPTKGGKRA